MSFLLALNVIFNDEITYNANSNLEQAKLANKLAKLNKNYYVIDLQQLWKDMAGSDYNVTQAGIFVKKGLKLFTNIYNCDIISRGDFYGQSIYPCKGQIQR